MRHTPLVLAAMMAIAIPGEGAHSQSAATGGGDQAPAEKGGGTLVIYRSHIAPVLFKATIEIDGHKVAALGNGEVVTIPVSPGAHRLSLKWPKLSGESGRGADIRIGGGEKSYLAIVARGWGSLMHNPPTVLQPTDEDSATAAITACCRPVSPEE